MPDKIRAAELEELSVEIATNGINESITTQGSGPDFPKYWIEEDYLVAEGCPVSSETKKYAENLLSPLMADHIVETAVVCMPEDGFTHPGNWAKQFGQYYEMGLSEGDRKNNSFVWLIRYDPKNQDDITISYAVGAGLPALTVIGLDPIEVQTESIASEKGLDEAVQYLAEGFTTFAREKYEPYEPEAPYIGGPIEEAEAETKGSTIKWVLFYVFMIFLVVETGVSLLALLTGDPDMITLMITIPLYFFRLLLYIFLMFGSGSSSSSRSSGGGGSSSRNRS